jgi:hypothetical protein
MIERIEKEIETLRQDNECINKRIECDKHLIHKLQTEFDRVELSHLTEM